MSTTSTTSTSSTTSATSTASTTSGGGDAQEKVLVDTLKSVLLADDVTVDSSTVTATFKAGSTADSKAKVKCATGMSAVGSRKLVLAYPDGTLDCSTL